MDKSIVKAAKFLEDGKLICFPTETVYALAANAEDESAVQRIYELKKRDGNKPLALFCRDLEDAAKIVEINDAAQKIAAKFCPGPITLVLPKAADSSLPKWVNCGLDTVAVRIPGHEVAMAILQQVKCPVVATSANISDMDEAVDAAGVVECFGDKVDYIIEGSCANGVASTVVDLTGEPRILRQGQVSLEEILGSIN